MKIFFSDISVKTFHWQKTLVQSNVRFCHFIPNKHIVFCAYIEKMRKQIYDSVRGMETIRLYIPLKSMIITCFSVCPWISAGRLALIQVRLRSRNPDLFSFFQLEAPKSLLLLLPTDKRYLGKTLLSCLSRQGPKEIRIKLKYFWKNKQDF